MTYHIWADRARRDEAWPRLLMLRAAQLKRRSVQVLSATPSLPPPSSSVPVPSPSHLPAQLAHSTTISELQVDHSTRNRSSRREASSSQESTRSPDNRSSRKGSPGNRSSDSDGLDHKHSQAASSHKTA